MVKKDSKRFKLEIERPTDDNPQYCIIDAEQEDLTIYNDLGCIDFTSAPALCDLLNELDTENKKLLNLKEYLTEKIEMFEKCR